MSCGIWRDAARNWSAVTFAGRIEVIVNVSPFFSLPPFGRISDWRSGSQASFRLATTVVGVAGAGTNSFVRPEIVIVTVLAVPFAGAEVDSSGPVTFW